MTLGLFFYELRGIQRCDILIKTGKDLEGLLGVRGQFERRPSIITAIGEPLAAYVIYSAVLAVWIFVAFVFIWSQWTGVLALVVFDISLAGSYIWHRMVIKKVPNTGVGPSMTPKVIDQEVQLEDARKVGDRSLGIG